MAKKIKKQTAKAWANKFRSKHPGQVYSVMFTKAEVDAILKQTECEGLRIYNAFSEGEDGMPTGYTMFLVGTDAKGGNLLPVDEASTTGQYIILDDGTTCPPDCPPNDL